MAKEIKTVGWYVGIMCMCVWWIGNWNTTLLSKSNSNDFLSLLLSMCTTLIFTNTTFSEYIVKWMDNRAGEITKVNNRWIRTVHNLYSVHISDTIWLTGCSSFHKNNRVERTPKECHLMMVNVGFNCWRTCTHVLLILQLTSRCVGGVKFMRSAKFMFAR